MRKGKTSRILIYSACKYVSIFFQRFICEDKCLLRLRLVRQAIFKRTWQRIRVTRWNVKSIQQNDIIRHIAKNAIGQEGVISQPCYGCAEFFFLYQPAKPSKISQRMVRRENKPGYKAPQPMRVRQREDPAAQTQASAQPRAYKTFPFLRISSRKKRRSRESFENSSGV